MAFLASCTVAVAQGVSPAYVDQSGQPKDTLVEAFQKPPLSARLRAYWWRLNGNVTKEAITKDLEWMHEIGMGGALSAVAGGTHARAASGRKPAGNIHRQWLVEPVRGRPEEEANPDQHSSRTRRQADAIGSPGTGHPEGFDGQGNAH